MKEGMNESNNQLNNQSSDQSIVSEAQSSTKPRFNVRLPDFIYNLHWCYFFQLQRNVEYVNPLTPLLPHGERKSVPMWQQWASTK